MTVESPSPDEPGPVGRVEPHTDEVLAHRAKLARQVKLAKRVGWGLFAYAMVAFAVGAARGFVPILIDTILIAMLIGSILLVPAIVFGYGIRAADREDRQRTAAPGSADSATDERS